MKSLGGKVGLVLRMEVGRWECGSPRASAGTCRGVGGNLLGLHGTRKGKIVG